ncbi:methionine gamma-lyase family protein [Dethiobacter alkaliphilus]|uniref:methionine gamma-lyase family protein n=1 Tax=Dethiobacter alkaliphilus TaxID=427926 RepID=UPI0023EE7F06|nr:methionine gamma-lyase family protein [Dethiobacter alkaliphilus]
MNNYKKYQELLSTVEREIIPQLAEVDETALYNQGRVLEAFKECRVDETSFYDSTGYGYNDIGREQLDRLYALVFGSEAALVRSQFVSGTHAISCCLYSVLSPGDRLVSLTGKPYDTLQKALGLTAALPGDLASQNITYDEVDLTAGLDQKKLAKVLTEKPKAVLIQRSRGYAGRRALTVEDIKELTAAVKKHSPDSIVFVDNCYGEFVDEREPCHVGVDLLAGSLIKNPGAGLAPLGGYVAGRADLVEKAAWRLTAPGLGSDIGAMPGVKRLFFQGLFQAPHQVGQALKGMMLAAALFARLGYTVSPKPGEKRGDIVQAVQLGDPQLLQSFCRAVQSASPVDSHLTPQPAPMPGYRDEVIMAAGTFVQGASSEFSADAPLRPPYQVFMQGGLTYEHVKLALATVLDRLEISPTS